MKLLPINRRPKAKEEESPDLSAKWEYFYIVSISSRPFHPNVVSLKRLSGDGGIACVSSHLIRPKEGRSLAVNDLVKRAAGNTKESHSSWRVCGTIKPKAKHAHN